MFKFTVAVIAVLAVYASSAAAAQQGQQLFQRPRGGAQQAAQGQRDQMAAEASKQRPDKVLYVTEVKDSGYEIGDMLQSALHALIKLPKKVAGTAAALIVGKLKSLNAKGLLKTALLAGLVAIFGAVAAVVAVSVAALVSAVTGICAAVLHFKNYLGGGGAEEAGAKGRSAQESQIDYVAEFVLDAFDKYGEKQ